MYDPHLKEHEDVLAARYALGVAASSEIGLAETRLVEDDSFAARVAHYDVLFSELDDGAGEIKPPPGLWDRIDAAIDDFEKSPATATVRTAQRNWEPFAPGVERKILHVDAAAGAQILLYRVAAHTAFGAHGHVIAEECLVLDGEIEVDGVTIRTGDVHIAHAGTRHGILSTRTGALLYVRADIEMQA